MQFYHNKTVLVTGAAGFIASHLIDNLLSQNTAVTGVDNLLTGNKENLAIAFKNNKFRFIQADVINAPESYLPKTFQPDIIFHLASPASPLLFQKYPVETYLVNSIGTHHLLQYLLEHNQDARFVYSSSSEAYGNPLEHPQKETYWGNVNPNGVRACYDEAKRFGETVCGIHFRDFGLDVRIARIFNTYGPRMDAKDGRVVPNFITQILLKKPITIYGEGLQTRSFCYVDDLVHGLLLLGAKDEAKGETINLGNPIEKTMIELAAMLQKITDTRNQVIYKELPKDDPQKRKPDISKAKKLLGWEPTILLEDGLKKTMKHFTFIAY